MKGALRRWQSGGGREKSGGRGRTREAHAVALPQVGTCGLFALSENRTVPTHYAWSIHRPNLNRSKERLAEFHGRPLTAWDPRPQAGQGRGAPPGPPRDSVGAGNPWPQEGPCGGDGSLVPGFRAHPPSSPLCSAQCPPEKESAGNWGCGGACPATPRACTPRLQEA